MNCRLCFQNFKLEDSKKHPRVLIQCGHTFCDECIKLSLNFHKEIICKECGKSNHLNEGNNFPLNQTLMGILRNNEERLSQFIKEYEICKAHGKKLEAYCESDEAILCLSCILGEHKSHKVISIDEKVSKEKEIMRECEKNLFQSEQILNKKEEQCKGLIDKLQLDMNEYVFQINLLYKNIANQLKELEEAFILQTKKNIEKYIKEIKASQQLVKEKKDFYHQLKNVHLCINSKSGVQFLTQINKRLFLIQNSQLKQKFNLPYQKHILPKQKILNSTINSLQQLLNFEKNKKSISNHKKQPQNQIKNTDKSLRQNDTFVKNIQESPYRLQKKNVTSVQKVNKQPQILEVNLVEKYEKHQQSKNMKKRNSQIQISGKGKSPKIEYEVKKEIQIFDRNSSKISFNKGYNSNDEFRTKMPSYRAQNGKKSSQNSVKIGKNDDKCMSSRKFNSNISDDLTSSFLNETYFIKSPEKMRNQNQTFEVETPLSINSFMESSQFTIMDERKDYTVLKDSRASFTMFCLQEKIFHFGGLKNDSISCQKMIPNQQDLSNFSNHLLTQGLHRSKAQCVIMKNYNPRKCLILGGKDQNGERSNLIYEFDIENNELKKSHLELNVASSGFGAVINQNRLYVFGGSSSSALKCLYEYRLGKNGFEVKKLSSMINSRDELGFAMGFDGYLYVGGGINSTNVILNSCERYCFESNKWSSMPAMKSPRRSFSLVSLPNGLFAIGGHDGKSFLRSVQMYNFDKEVWVQVAPMSQGRFTHTAVSTNDYQHIMVFGGFEVQPLRTVQIYSTLSNNWTLGNDMDRERYLHCSIVVQQ